jgi:hypothetical protein
MADEIVNAFASAWPDGPSSDPTDPDKAQIRQVGVTIQTAVDTLEVSGDTITRKTWVQLAAITGTRLGQRAYVEADTGTHTDPVVGGTVQNSGIYAWSTSPAGWQWMSADEVGLLNTAKSVVTALWEPFTDAALNSADWMAAARAVRDITFLSQPADPVRLTILSKDDAFGKDNIQVRDADGENWQNLTEKGSPPTGIQSITLTASDGREAIIVIDYSYLPESKVYVNDGASTLTFSRVATKVDASVAARADAIRSSAPWLDPSVSDAEILANETVIRAIKDVAAYPIERAQHRLTVLTLNDATFRTSAALRKVGQTVNSHYGINANGTQATVEEGLIRVDFGATEGSTRGTGALWFDPTGFANGVIISNSNSPILLNPDYISPRWQTESRAEPHPDQLRISLGVSSITWGYGYNGWGSYVGLLERFLRERLATTYLAQQLYSPSQTATMYYTEDTSYRGVIGKWSGVGASCGCRLYGDEISIAVAKERGNANAAIVELLIDGAVYDTFSTYNPLPAGTQPFSFTGDGVTTVFDLGKIGTYGHVLTVDGISRSVRLYDWPISTGGGFQPSDFALVVRQAIAVGGNVEVHHVLAFKDPPANGAAIGGSFSYGETIKPDKTTIGNKLVGIGSGLESPYGDGDVSFDPSAPATFSSGLDFRQTDDRAIQTWRFTDKRIRDVKFRVKDLDPRASGETPALFVGYVTNRAHRIQNAGIGGGRVDDWLDTTDLKTTRQVAAFKPTHVIIESSTNDDWQVGSWKATRVLAGQTRAQVRGVRNGFDLTALSGSGENYTVTTSHIAITGVTPFSVTFAAGPTFNIAGDGSEVLILGDFHQDQRRVVARVISGWDAGTRTVSFDEELTLDDLAYIDSLAELAGSTAQVRQIGGWADNVELVVNQLRAKIAGVKILMGTGGIPNIQHRLLEGYRELGMRKAAELGIGWIDFYRMTEEWTYQRFPARQLYIGPSANTEATGATSYVLYDASGVKPTNSMLRNARVYVNGVERINNGCYIRGGNKRGWASDVTTLTLNNQSYVVDEHTLVFDAHPPASGDDILVFVNEDWWSSDDTHPYSTTNAEPTGNLLFCQAVVRAMNADLQRISQ